MQTRCKRIRLDRRSHRHLAVKSMEVNGGGLPKLVAPFGVARTLRSRVGLFQDRHYEFGELLVERVCGFRLDWPDAPSIPSHAEMIRVHPAHVTARSVIVIEVSMKTPLGTASSTVE